MVKGINIRGSGVSDENVELAAKQRAMSIKLYGRKYENTLIKNIILEMKRWKESQN